ncbi:GntR family transcriptional regulator [soil metagenome]
MAKSLGVSEQTVSGQEKESLQGQLGEISNLPLRQKIFTALREAILSGELKPCQHLGEMTLASQLFVSRAPLREALQSLSKDGLIETVPYRGTKVRSLSRKDIEEIYSLRGLHEGFAIRRITERGQVEDVAKLWAICAAMQEAAEAKDYKQLNLLDDTFHRTLIVLAEHDMLLNIWNQLSMRVRQIMSLRNHLNQNPMEVALNHPPLVDAIAAGEADSAVAMIQKHVASAADLVIDEIIEDLATE